MAEKELKLPKPIPTAGVVDFDKIVVGLADYLEANGIPEITYLVEKEPKVVKNTWGSWIQEGDVDLRFSGKVKSHSYKTELDLMLAALREVVDYPGTLDIFVEILIGKYKGSIARLKWGHLHLGVDPVSHKSPRVPCLSAKNLRLATEATGTSIKYEKKQIATVDSFENENAEGDIIVFIESGRLCYGTYIGVDSLNSRLILRDSDARQVFLKPERDMMNITKMPENVMKNNLLKARLTVV